MSLEEFADTLVHQVLNPMGLYIDDASAIVIHDKDKFVKALIEHIEEVK